MLFLLSYLIAIPIRFILRAFIPGAFSLDPSLAPPVLLLDIAWPIVIVVCTCTFLGAKFGRAFGIALALGGGIWAGVVIHTNAADYPVILSTTLAIFGLCCGMTLASAKDIKSKNRFPAVIGHLVGIVVGTPLGIFAGLQGGYIGGYLTYTTMQNDLHWTPDLTKIVGVGNVVGAITGFLVARFLGLAVEAAIQASIKTKVSEHTKVGVQRGLSTGRAFCLIGGTVVGGTISLYISYQKVLGIQTIQNSLTYIILPNLPAGLAAALAFMAGYYRLQLYPFSSLSSMIACWASRRNPPKVFEYLRWSAIYWDECVFLPLPGLQEMLYIAVTQNPRRALKEIQFVVEKRPTQAGQVHQAMLEWLLRELETYEGLDQMQKVAGLLEPFLHSDANYLNPAWVALFIHLSNASLQVRRYLVFFERANRIEALEQTIKHLKRVQLDVAFHNEHQNRRLKNFVRRWRGQAGKSLTILQEERALTTLKDDAIEADIIDNPYITGPALPGGDLLFVGRQDIIEKLKEDLALNRRSAFSLKGERRMGKTSMLNQLQLQKLLGTNCLFIKLDLQSPSARATLVDFLKVIAEEIQKTALDDPHFFPSVPELDGIELERVARENEGRAYGIFEEWLKDIEAILQHDQKKLLLAFDEFEKLGENTTGTGINLTLLLDWFRSMTANHPCLALLFCGVKSPAEMGWADHFVHVETLPVSFLRENEARELIIKPLSNKHLPAQDIFNNEVVSEIIRVTACHPFLIQAICSELIDILNENRCKSASLQDVPTAIDHLLEHWDSFFVDLWNHPNKEQRSCLKVLVNVGQATAPQLAQYTHLDEKVVHQTVKKLLERGLITGSKRHFYSITIPIFSIWAQRRIMEEERG